MGGNPCIGTKTLGDADPRPFGPDLDLGFVLGGLNAFHLLKGFDDLGFPICKPLGRLISDMALVMHKAGVLWRVILPRNGRSNSEPFCAIGLSHSAHRPC